MGEGTSSGVQTPKQVGVITVERENFPHIPEGLLKMSPSQIQERIDRTVSLRALNSESLFPSLEREAKLEDAQFLLECAKTAVERQRKSTERG